MRVNAGRFRGRKLLAPAGRNTRPILDRVKVSLFDWLGSRLALPGTLPPLQVLDLFSGPGSLGIEALSRGAAFCAFVEPDRAAFDCLRTNLDRLGIGPAARAIQGSAATVVVAPSCGSGFGLIFLDPPYRLSEDLSSNSLMGRVFARLGTTIPVEPIALVAWRHSAACILTEDALRGWRSSDRRTWGNMAITLLERVSQG